MVEAEESEMVYLTGDKHGFFMRVFAFCDTVGSTTEDVLIILGDVCINYFGDEKDRAVKRLLEKLPVTLFCIHGNHEQRPENPDYEETTRYGGAVYHEPVFPNLLFAKDGEIYEFAGKRCLVIGGAYSVDKPYRIAEGWGWWPDEQPSPEVRERVERRLDAEDWRVDVVLSHTCPLKYEPHEMFIGGVSQENVDKSTEIWLDAIESGLEYGRWYCGHHHTDKTVDKLRFLYDDFIELR
ncbi:MAG: metallophosphoesterase [Treponema sp.]|nr:metallophosphoesterase [Treponema sp.]